jgi:hypothetical protein
MKRLILAFSLAFFLFSSPAHAVCPVCTVTVAGGLGISRWLGIDDAVTGIWIGGLIISGGLWLADWLGKKGWKASYREIISVGLFLLFILPPLFWAKMASDNLLLGIFTGSVVFLSGLRLDRWLRAANCGKVFVNYQKVIVPVFLLLLASFILYIVTI